MKPVADIFSKHWKLSLYGLLIVLAAFAFGRCSGRHQHAPAPQTAQAEEPETQRWTCSMHPQIKLPNPGKCPICGMDLIPLETSDTDNPRELTVSPASATLMQIETAPVERRFVQADVRMIGKVDYDETRTAFITARMPGRLDRLFVDYIGVHVKQGDHMASIYSPELLSAQEELLQALKSVAALKDSQSSIVRSVSQSTVEAVREKLRLWGLTPEQIREIETRGTTTDHVTIYSPVGGIVIHKNAQEGGYVKTGDRIYTVADLSHVWVQLEAYESDLPWLRYGQNVTFTAEAWPGETFEGTIAFIDPVLNAATRTANVRINVDNPALKMKPGMFVRAVAHPLLAEDGKVANPSLAGKWISPMHPEIVKDVPGTCDVCGMPLVPAEELGYVTSDATNAPLVIPATAPLITGTRAVVYVELPDQEQPTYVGREITLGPKAGNSYIVRDGLSEGERVVTHGAFKLDAELQIRAKPSMMTPQDGDAEKTAMSPQEIAQMKPAAPKPVSGTFGKELNRLVAAYLSMQQALAADQFEPAQTAVQTARTALDDVPMELLSGAAHMQWMKQADALEKTLSEMADTTDLDAFRMQFTDLSETMTTVLQQFPPTEQPLYVFHCPMALDSQGANWLQDHQQTENPYFGEAMPTCGEMTRQINASNEHGESPDE